MDDLAGLDWNASSTKQSMRPTLPPTGANYFASFSSTPPISGRSTPSIPPQQSKPVSPAPPASRPTTASHDSFANLLPTGNPAQNKNLSLQEQQRRRQEEQAKRLGISQSNASRDPWDRLGGMSPLPNPASSPFKRPPPPGSANLSATINKPFAPIAGRGPLPIRATTESEDDLLAAFNSSAPVDKSSHFPVPSSSASSARASPAPAQQSSNSGGGLLGDDDDDPFGLGTNRPSSTGPPPAIFSTDDDDFMGDLGKPVSELPARKRQASTAPTTSVSDPLDRAIAELVDMGFPAERARTALEESGPQPNLQAAVGWLLNQAHSETNSRRQTAVNGGRPAQVETQSSRNARNREDDSSGPTWMREPGRSSSAPRRDDTESPASGEKDAAQVASELGSNLWKGANSLWKTGQKKLNKAVAELNAVESDNSKPKWMHEAQPQVRAERSSRQTKLEHNTEKADPSITDEAMMLEARDAPRPSSRTHPQPQPLTEPRRQTNGSAGVSRDHSPATPSPIHSTQSPQPRFLPQQQQQRPDSARSKLSRQAVEEDTAQAYISPARRKKAIPKPAEPEPDLLFGDSSSSKPPSSSSSFSQPSRPLAQPSRPAASRQTTPIPVRPKPPTRQIPPLSSIAYQSCTQHRLAGAAAFRLGNYAAATDSYTAALRALPAHHPLSIPLYTNRALTHHKTGDAKASLADAESALETVGPGRGVAEVVALGAGDEKDMAPFWAKAMVRRAEALESMERLKEAGEAWRSCVEAGIGGATAIQGRNRCEKALAARSAPAPKVVAIRKAAPRPRPKTAVSALADMNGIGGGSAGEAVDRLRAANRAAERADEEKFRLADAVDARLSRWRKGKETNLRALLGSLDSVLWEGSGWRKVGMGDLIVAAKVKVAYMKGIAKVHPDKLPTTATTEQVMISGAVFSTLNEAWDKFKTENGL